MCIQSYHSSPVCALLGGSPALAVSRPASQVAALLVPSMVRSARDGQRRGIRQAASRRRVWGFLDKCRYVALG